VPPQALHGYVGRATFDTAARYCLAAEDVHGERARQTFARGIADVEPGTNLVAEAEEGFEVDRDQPPGYARAI
jgi:hypothetical protein